MVNEEISELSDSIKQMATDIDDIENSERNSAKNLKSSAGQWLSGYLGRVNK